MDAHKHFPPAAGNAHPYVLPTGAASHISLTGIEPEAGLKVIQDIIDSAKKSLWIEMYLFDNETVAQMLLHKKAEHPDLDLRLLYHHPDLPDSLDPTRSGRFPRWAQPNKGIRVDGEPVTMHHAKFILVDADVAGHGHVYIMTANFTAQALGGNHAGYANREYIIGDSDPEDVALLKAVFLADQNGKPLPKIPDSSNLVISDYNAIYMLPLLLKSAKKSINIQVEYLNDPPGHGSLDLKQILLHAASQGVKIELMLPPLEPSVPGAPTADNHETYQALTPEIAVNVTPQYFMHAKMIIIDKQVAFVGSQNLSHQSLRYSREVGILISSKVLVARLLETFEDDWKFAQKAVKKHHLF